MVLLPEVKEALQKNIISLISRNCETGKNGIYSIWGSDPLLIIVAIANNYKSIDIFKLIEDQLFTAIFNILLNPKQTYSEKTSCMKTLIQIKNLFDKEDYLYEWENLAQKIEAQYSDVLKGTEIGFVDIGSRSTLEINILTFLSMCDRGSFENTIWRFIELSNEGAIEEIELVKCLAEFVKSNKSSDEFALANIFTILLQKSLHEVFEVRWYVTEALWNLTYTKLRGYIHAKIYALSEDANYMLRHKILELAQEMYNNDPINAELILRKGINDYNYVVRKRAEEAIKELGL